MKPEKAAAYWPARIMLAVGIVAVLLSIGGAWVLLSAPPPMSGEPTSVPGLPNRLVVIVVALAVEVVGLAWMVRIFRGPRDEPPLWRYRDR
jgi:hypothetical protein